MPMFQRISEPSYYRHFQCIAAACPDSCCTGWDVAIDQTTYELYQNCRHVKLQPLFRQHIVRNTEPVGTSGYIPYALIKMQNSHCPFHDSDGLCLIQKKLGETALSATCASFPRSYTVVDGVLERSLNLSCPEAARLVLLSDTPLRFGVQEAEVTLPHDQIDTLDTATTATGKPFRHFQPIRAIVLATLQNRSYPVWQRGLLLNLFCHQLGLIRPAEYDERIPRLLEDFSDHVQNGTLRDSLAQAETMPELQLQAMKLLIDHRLQLGLVGDSFLQFAGQFRQAMGYSAGDSPQDVALRYQTAYTEYYRPFMEQHEVLLENYLVNYVFKKLFPFGPQQGRLLESRSIYEEFCLLVIHFSLIKTLLIGLAGTYRDSFTRQHAAALIQSFAKTIEHHRPYLNQALGFLVAGNLNNTGGMTMLIKN